MTDETREWRAVIEKRCLGYLAHYTDGLMALVGDDWALTRRGIERRARRVLLRCCAQPEHVATVQLPGGVSVSGADGGANDDEMLAKIARLWSRDGGMGNDRSEEDYDDAGCRVLARHAFRDVNDLLAEVRRLRSEVAGLQARINAEAKRLRDHAEAFLYDGDHDRALPGYVEVYGVADALAALGAAVPDPGALSGGTR